MDLLNNLRQYEARRVARGLKTEYGVTVDQAFGMSPLALAQSLIPTTVEDFQHAIINMATRIAELAGRK
jgi:hypothetical protein